MGAYNRKKFSDINKIEISLSCKIKYKSCSVGLGMQVHKAVRNSDFFLFFFFFFGSIIPRLWPLFSLFRMTARWKKGKKPASLPVFILYIEAYLNVLKYYYHVENKRSLSAKFILLNVLSLIFVHWFYLLTRLSSLF